MGSVAKKGMAMEAKKGMAMDARQPPEPQPPTMVATMVDLLGCLDQILSKATIIEAAIFGQQPDEVAKSPSPCYCLQDLLGSCHSRAVAIDMVLDHVADVLGP